MRRLKEEEYCWLVAGGRLLGWDEDEKVLALPGGRVVKLFAVKWRTSLSLVIPRSTRFVRHCRRLAALGIPAPEPSDHFFCRSTWRFGVVYRYLSGRSIAELESDGAMSAARTRQLARFIARVHEAGILFRSLHPGNVLLLDCGAFALIDVADVRFRHRPLTSRERLRNFAHLCRRPEHRALWGRVGWGDMLEAYCRAGNITGPQAVHLRERAARLI